MPAVLPPVEQQILDLAASVFNAYSVVLFLPDAEENEDPGTSRMTASFSLGESLNKDCRFQPGQGLVGWILRNRQPLSVPDFDQQHSNLDYYREGEEAEIRAFMGVPVPTGGALCVDTKSQREFSERDSRLLQLFAQLLDSARQSSGTEAVLGDIPEYFMNLGIIADLRSRHMAWNDYIHSFLACLASATGFEYSAFATVHVPDESYCIECENTPVLVHGGEPFFQSMNSGLAGWVFRNAQPVVQTGEDSRPPALFGSSAGLPIFDAVVCLPVTVFKTTRGVICLGHSAPRHADEAMRTFLSQALSHLSVHLENLYLRGRIRDLMERAQVYRSGPRMHDPDRSPYVPPRTEEE